MSSKKEEAPLSIIKRLPVYLRVLDNLLKRDVDIISSKNLSNETGFTAEQIRKDLAYFGAFGTRGTGYNTSYLREKILRIIGLDQATNVIVVGAGHLGTAFARYNIQENPYTNVVALFDVDPEKVGEYIDDVKIHHLNELETVVQKENVRVGVLTVPAVYAQEVLNRLVNLDVKALLNFSPANLSASEDVRIHDVDLTIELQSLIYYSTVDLKEKAKYEK